MVLNSTYFLCALVHTIVYSSLLYVYFHLQRQLWTSCPKRRHKLQHCLMKLKSTFELNSFRQEQHQKETDVRLWSLEKKLDELLELWRHEYQHKHQSDALNLTGDSVLSAVEDSLKAFDSIKEGLQKIKMPNQNNLGDSWAGIKKEYKGALKVISKCGRVAEAGLKWIAGRCQAPSTQAQSFHVSDYR